MKYVLISIWIGFIGQSGYAQLKMDSFRGQPVLICGHRGGFYKNIPENSLIAFDSTCLNGAVLPMMVELDIRKSKDGTLFITHDETVDRTTNGIGKISELSNTYLKSLFLKNHTGITTEKIPTFDDILYFARMRNIILLLDIKVDVWDEVLNILREKELINKAILLTFHIDDSKRVYKLAQNIRISCLINDENDWKKIKNFKFHILI